MTSAFRSILVPAFVLISALLASCASSGKTVQTKAATPPQAATVALEDSTSVEAVRKMGLGWNLGNTMEACGDWIKGQEVINYETAWGNPETTREMIAKIKASGFKSVRIPVAWSNLMYGKHKIEPELLKRVRRIVDWVLAEGMVAVVNIHWDGGWWSKFPVEPEKSMGKYKAVWSQIAGYFADYPAALIFESLNEEGCFGDVWNRWGGGTEEQRERAYGILNDINQVFVDLVRASGGRNGNRHLLIAGYCTDIDLTVHPLFLMPQDPANRCIASVHYYTPYTFAGLEKDESWGKMRMTWGTPEDLQELDSNVKKLKDRFLDQGVPVILGEYGSTTKKDPGSVRRYILTVAERFYRLGMCPMLWDPGTHFDRRTLEFKDPDLAEGFRKLSRTERD